MSLDLSKVLELLTALAAGGILTMVVKALIDKNKSKAEARKIAVDGEIALVEMAMRMTDKLQTSLKSLEDKTEDLARKNLKLEHELSELRLSNINLLREIEALKRQNDDLERTCSVLIKENNHLRVELENCIKKEV
jgi:predicted RNase H-like nuclease (RuvC/YqgF family)